MTYTVYGLKDPTQPTYRYVGLTSGKPTRRLTQHRRAAVDGSQLPVHQWMREVGPKTVIMDILEETPEDSAYLGYAEKYWIAELKSLGHDLLNRTSGGYGATGLIWTPESRAKISGEGNPFFGKNHTESTRSRMKASAPRTAGEDHHLYGRKQAPEHIQKRTENSERWTDEAREEQARLWRENNPMLSLDFSGENNPFYGKNHTPETRARMSESAKRKPPVSDEARAKMSAAQKRADHSWKKGRPAHNKGVPMSEEQKLKVSLAKKKFFHDRDHSSPKVGCIHCEKQNAPTFR